MNSEQNNNQLTWVIILSLVIGLIIGYYIRKNENSVSPREYSCLEELEEKDDKVEKYEECLSRSRDAVENAIGVLEYPQNYGGVYDAIEEAKGLLEDTDFCGL